MSTTICFSALAIRIWSVRHELVYDAYEQSDPSKRISMAREALKIAPDCAQAYVLLAEDDAKTPQEALHYYEQGVAAGERAMEPGEFEELTGDFWEVIETRPYMRAREGLASTLWGFGPGRRSASALSGDAAPQPER